MGDHHFHFLKRKADAKSCSHTHHHHHHANESRGTNNIVLALAANMSFALIELVGGYWTKSTAIQADAIHDLGDSAALGTALLLQIVARFPPRAGFSYGLRRFSLLSAVMTSLLLLAGSVFVAVHALSRFQSPVTPHLDGMLGLAILGVVVNGFAAWRMSRGETQNEKALAWHMMEDLLGWIAVLISSFIMRFWDVPWIDPFLAIVIAVVILLGASRSLWVSGRLFLQAVPSNVSEETIKEKVESLAGVLRVVSMRIWSLDGENHVCTTQVEISQDDLVRWPDLRERISRSVQNYGSFDLTIEPVVKH